MTKAMTQQQRSAKALATGKKIDRLIPGFMLSSPISTIGFWFGRSVGFVWGSVWSTGKVERRGDVYVFTGLPKWAFPRGGVCVGDCFLTGSRPDDRVVKHESVHARQWRHYGMLMPVLYALAGRNALANRFEIEAGLEDGNYLPRRRSAPVRATAEE